MMPFTHLHLTEIPSTNAWARQQCQQLSRRRLTVITADSQTAGRGQFQRVWHSPPYDNIYSTFVFFIPAITQTLSSLGLVMATVLVRILHSYGLEPKLKWPNDILLENDKLGGILIETAAVDDQIAVIAGMGVNVNMPIDALRQIDQPATSLKKVLGKTVDRELLFKEYLQAFIPALALFLQKGFEPFYDDYTAHLQTQIGEGITCRVGAQQWKGKLQAVQKDGALVIQLPAGETKICYAGEIIHS